MNGNPNQKYYKLNTRDLLADAYNVSEEVFRSWLKANKVLNETVFEPYKRKAYLPPVAVDLIITHLGEPVKDIE